MIETAFYYSGFKRTLCGSKWDTYKSSWSTSTARYGCCSANTYMSSPEGTGTFVEADSCSACPAGTFNALTSVPNDEISCQLCDVGSYSKQGSTSCTSCNTGCSSTSGSASCDANTCTPTQVANSNKAAANIITGTLNFFSFSNYSTKVLYMYILIALFSPMCIHMI